jgi:hypothetical protein
MPSYFPENNEPKPMDSSDRSLQKINSLLNSGISSTAGGILITNFRTKIVRFTPVVDTSAYAAGDVLFNTTAVTVADTAAATRGTILSASIVDRDDEASQTITLYFLRSNANFGTINAAPSITDDGAFEIIGTATVTTGTDLGGCKFGESSGLVIPFELTSNTLFVAATTGGTPTFSSASDIRVRLSLQLEAPV